MQVLVDKEIEDIIAMGVIERSEAAYASHVAQSCYSVIGDNPFLWSKPKFDPP